MSYVFCIHITMTLWAVDWHLSQEDVIEIVHTSQNDSTFR